MTDQLDISIEGDVQAAIEEHAFSRIDVEVGGFLIGHADAKSVRILQSRPALAAESGQTHLTFTHEAWADVLEFLDTEGSGEQIVGWYHTHPNFGCFLSEHDQFIQENFFSGPGQVALVIDPVRGESAYLCTRDGEVVTLREGATRRAALGQDNEDTVDVIERMTRSTEKSRGPRAPVVLGGLVLAVLAGLLGWFFGNITGQDAARNEARAQVEQLRGEIETIEMELDAALAVEDAVGASEPQPELTPLPETEPEAVTEPPGPQLGDEVQIAVIHTIRSGETLWGLAARYLGSGERYVEIVDANPGINPVRLQVGDSLRVPMSGGLIGFERDMT
jgi:proteasome lid subunit RPN8/RPN11